MVMTDPVIIENKQRRDRLNSLPIFTALGAELLNEEDKDNDDKEGTNVMNHDENKKRDRKSRESVSSDIKSDGEVNSPDSKKVRMDQNEVMATMDMVNEELAIVYATEAISKLGLETNDNDIKKLIDCYNPIIDMEMMKKHMLEASENWSEKESKYKSAIKFVVNDEKVIEETDIGELAEMLLGDIVNRTTKYCNDCRNWYMVGRENKPRIFCTWCKVGKHDCKKLNEIEKIHGLQWFCSECNELFTLKLQPQMKRSTCMNKNIFKGFKESDILGKNAIEEINKKIEEIRRKGTVLVEDEIIDLAKDDVIDLAKVDETNQRKEKEEKEKIEQEKKEQEQKEQEKKELEKEKVRKNEDTSNKETKQECWFWSNRKCKYGDRCKYEHTIRCKPMMEKGECPDSRCKLSHPKICRSIYYEGYCSRQNCWYIHPSNIVNRYQYKDHNNDNNNQVRNGNAFNSNNFNQNNISNGSNINLYSRRNWNQDNNNNNCSQHNIGNDGYNNTHQPTFLEQWPTPWETRNQMKMMMGSMIEQMNKFMNMSN